MTKVLPLISGGINSTVMLYRELITKGHEVTPLTVNYGQKNVGHERDALLKIWGNLNSSVDQKTSDRLSPIKFLDLSIMRYIFKSGITWPDIEIPDHGTIGKDDWNPSVVPFRDPFLISTAVACANLVGAERILIGNNELDSNYITLLKQLVFIGSKEQIHLEVPFIDTPKAEIIKMGNLLKVSFENTYGCYRHKPYPCGKCDSCVERKRAFNVAGIEDKTIYSDDIRAKKG
jgi:7-cyano-7-deazaguanine synthase